MADAPPTPPAPKPDDGLGDAGKKALDEERKARRDAEAQLKAAEARLKAIEDQGKTESEKRAGEMKALNDSVDALTKRLAESDAKSLRLEVATAKGLNAAQAKRLAGSTREELEADADEILEAFPAAAAGGGGGLPKPPPPPARKPVADLKGGNDPTEGDEPSIKDIVAAVPRL